MALATLACLAPATAGASVGADLRVVGPGGQLADLTQYSDTTTVPTSPQAVCFGPGSNGSGQDSTMSGPTALGIVGEAAKSRGPLNPLLLSDKYVPDGFGLAVCGIGGFMAEGNAFWYVKVDHKGLQVSGSLFEIHPGDQVLWTLVPNYPPGDELAMNAPVRGPAGMPLAVQVLAYADDGTVAPAAGATISGGASPAITDESGNATVTLSGAGPHQIQATRGADIPSEVTDVCAFDNATACPVARGRLMVGSDGNDDITGTAGNDQIMPRAGDDRVRALAGDDRIDIRGGGKDRVNCGGGNDTVKLGKGDKATKNCEHRSRSGKKHKKGKGGKKGGHKK
jgi:Ca2+-binding RTX toxin-like protein